MGLCGCLGSLVRLPGWSGLGTIFSSSWGYDVASLLDQGSRMDPTASTAHCLRTQIRRDCAPSSLARQSCWFCSAHDEDHWLCSLLGYHCKWGCRMGYASGPQPFWHWGQVLWKTVFPRTGAGGGGDGSGGNASSGERWGAADEASLASPLLTTCRAAQFLIGRRPILVRGPGVGDPWATQFPTCLVRFPGWAC